MVQTQLLEHNRKVSQTLPSFLHFCDPEAKNCSNLSILNNVLIRHRRRPGDFVPTVQGGGNSSAELGIHVPGVKF